MATSPTFVADVASLQSALRLSGLPAGEDGMAILNSAVLRVRTGFIRRLGAGRVAEIQAIMFEEDPEDDEQTLRASANECEIKWVRLHLLQTMPSLFMDNSGQTEEIWNTEGAFRQGRPSGAFLQELRDDLEADLIYLSGKETDVVGNFTCLDPEPEPPDPGDSLFGPAETGIREPIDEES